MANYTLTAASFVPSAAAKIIYGIFGEAVTAGQAVYLDAATGRYKLADNNASAATAAMVGIAANGGANGQPATICTEDPVLTHGLATLAAGDIAILSATAGALAPAADLASTNYPVVCLVAINATTAVFKITAGTAAKA